MTDTRKRILSVEDDKDSHELITYVLRDYEVVNAVTFAEGLDRAQRELYDLYLLDNWLPDGSGIDLCRNLRRFDRNTPILFLSGAVYEKDQQEALEAGAQQYLTKPVEIPKLQNVISELIQMAELRNLAAKVEELAAIKDEIADHLDKMEVVLGQCREQIKRVEPLSIKAKAYEAFIAAGGTRIAFERMWPKFFHSVLPPDD